MGILSVPKKTYASGRIAGHSIFVLRFATNHGHNWALVLGGIV